MTWTSWESVLASINHQEPDRVPIDFKPLKEFYINLKNFLGITLEESIKHNLAMEVIPHPLFLEKLGADVISVKLGSGQERSRLNIQTVS